MFVLFVLAIVLSIVFFKLGVLTVLVGVLKAMLQVLLFVLGGFGLYAVWKWLGNRRHSNPARPLPRLSGKH